MMDGCKNILQKNGMVCLKHGGEKRFIQSFGGETLRGDQLEDRSVDERMILKWISEKLDGGMDWIDLAQVRDRWRALVNAVMNLRVL
jgi:hypothetical protein